MKTFGAAFLILSMSVGSAFAECSYFRVSVELLKCSSMDPKIARAGEAYANSSNAPELDDVSPTQPFVQLSCTCSYTLMGSDLRCDPDQTVERSAVIGVDNVTNACLRGRSLCRDVCSPRLP